MMKPLLWGPALLALLAISCSDQGPANNISELTPTEAQENEPLQVTPLEEQARAALAARRTQRETQALDERVRRAMEGFLRDPFSARYRAVRAGRNGAICGEINAKNEVGAYVGFKDFVIGRDGRTVYTSTYNDGLRSAYDPSFIEAYYNACASTSQRRDYDRSADMMMSDYGYNGM